MKHTFISKSTAETLKFGEKLAKLLNLGDVVILKGDLGAGKTTITKGVALGLNITEKVNSPTFNIMKIYIKGDVPLFHIDAYRLENNNDDIGLDEFIGGQGITLIEWPDYIKRLLPKDVLEIIITHRTLEEREIAIIGVGRYKEAVEAIKGEFK